MYPFDKNNISFSSSSSATASAAAIRLPRQWFCRFRMSHDIIEGANKPDCFFPAGSCQYALSYRGYPPLIPSYKYAPGVDMGLEQSNQETKPMDETEGIPAKLSLTQTLFAADDDKALIRAKFMSGGELTESGRKALNLLFYKANKAALVELAKQLLAEAAEDSK